MMVHFRKRLSGNILKEINALIIEAHKQEPEREDNEHDDDNPPASLESEAKNKGALIVDATCAPEDMCCPES
jgi:hypothetical protein